MIVVFSVNLALIVKFLTNIFFLKPMTLNYLWEIPRFFWKSEKKMLALAGIRYGKIRLNQKGRQVIYEVLAL